MIKFASLLFVTFLTLIASLGIVSMFFPSWFFWESLMKFFGVGLLFSGVALILSLIVDRIKDARNEKKDDHYKKL